MLSHIFRREIFLNLIREPNKRERETIDFAINAKCVIIELYKYFCPANDNFF